MPDFKHKEGNGSLFKNDYKQKETQPDMKGKATLENGEIVDVAGWWNEGKSGQYLSISISAEYVKEENETPAAITGNDPGDEDDTKLPF